MPHILGGEVVWKLVSIWPCLVAAQKPVRLPLTWLRRDSVLGYLFSHPDILTCLLPSEGMRLLCQQDTEASGATLSYLVLEGRRSEHPLAIGGQRHCTQERSVHLAIAIFILVSVA